MRRMREGWQERKTNVCGGEGGCNKDEGGDKGRRGHKMLAMNVRWRRRGEDKCWW